jgi:hypothetical protein
MKKTLIFFNIFFLIAVLTGCSVINNQQKTENNQLKNQVNESQYKANTIEYSDTTYAFVLTFPKTWENYKKNEELTSFGKSISFGFDKQPSIFSITVLTKEKWDEIKNEDGPKPIYINENEKYVFGWNPAQYNANDEMLERMKEVKEIIATFRIIKRLKYSS